MSYTNVRLVGGPADGKYVTVPTGVSVYRVAEIPAIAPYYAQLDPDEPVELLCKTHEYVIGRAFPHRGYCEGIWQG